MISETLKIKFNSPKSTTFDIMLQKCFRNNSRSYYNSLTISVNGKSLVILSGSLKEKPSYFQCEGFF